MKKGFTLIELLVVVLIIGILSAIALPQYKKAVERAKMTEAVINLRAIANANRVYYMANGDYAGAGDMDKLDVQIPGEVTTQIVGDNRIATKDFIYSPTGSGHPYLAIAQRADNGVWRGTTKGYYLYIHRDTPNQINCLAYDQASDMEKKICAQINTNGTL